MLKGELCLKTRVYGKKYTVFLHGITVVYVIVNAQAEGFMAINLPTLRAQPEGEVWFIAIKPEALGINYIIYPT